VLEEMQAWAPARTPGELRSLLGVFQYSGDDVFKKVDVLSGGEKNRLALARLMLDPGNFILLDEPTNHLDRPAGEALEDALARYDGTLLFVSHDRYFINKVATKVTGLVDGKLRTHDGGYDAYRAFVTGAPPAQLSSKPASAVEKPPAGASKRSREDKKSEAQARNERSRKVRALRERVTAAEGAIAAAEARLDEIDARLADPSTYQQEGLARSLGDTKRAVQVELSRLNRQWEEALGELERCEAAEQPSP